MIIDTHAHIYAEEFDEDRDLMLQRASASGVGAILLPNIDCLLYTSPSPRDVEESRMPSSA